MPIALPAGRRAAQINTVARVLLWPLILLAIGTTALQFNAWIREQRFDGPFPNEMLGSRSLQVYIGKRVALGCCLEVRSDDNEHLFRSTLRLWINGVEMGPPHAAHNTIRQGNTPAFSHWGEHVNFSLPPGV